MKFVMVTKSHTLRRIAYWMDGMGRSVPKHFEKPCDYLSRTPVVAG
jgi:hypothetical protein